MHRPVRRPSVGAFGSTVDALLRGPCGAVFYVPGTDSCTGGPRHIRRAGWNVSSEHLGLSRSVASDGASTNSPTNDEWRANQSVGAQIT